MCTLGSDAIPNSFLRSGMIWRASLCFRKLRYSLFSDTLFPLTSETKNVSLKVEFPDFKRSFTQIKAMKIIAKCISILPIMYIYFKHHRCTVGEG